MADEATTERKRRTGDSVDPQRRSRGGLPPIAQVALIVGAMKCGTTSLFEHLARHPEICASARKEPMFFARDDWTGDMADYRQLWPDFDPARHLYALEASTGYSKWPDLPDVPPRIRDFAAEHGTSFKFIYILRDPLKMIASAIGHGQDQDWTKNDRDRLLRHLQRVADFEAQLGRYRACFPASDLHVLQLEKLVAEPERELAAIATFLGLSAPFPPAGAPVWSNSAAERREKRAGHAALGRLGPLADGVGALGRLIPEGPRRRVRGAAYRLLGRTLPGRAAPAEDWSLTAARARRDRPQPAAGSRGAGGRLRHRPHALGATVTVTARRALTIAAGFAGHLSPVGRGPGGGFGAVS